MKLFKKAIAGILTATMLLGCMVTASAATSPTNAPMPADQTNVTAATGETVSTSASNATCTIYATVAAKKVTIPETLEVGGVKYTVVAIGAKAFKKTVTSITIPSTVKTIKANAFTGAKKLKKITLKGTTVKVEKKAFKGLNTKKITIKISKKMSAKQVKKLTKQLKKAGFKGKIKK